MDPELNLNTNNSLVPSIISQAKQSALRMEFKTPDGKSGVLQCLSAADLEDGTSIQYLARWRDANQDWYPARTTITDTGTKNWLAKAILEQPLRILFWVIDSEKRKIGHVGLFRFNEQFQFCEIDNILRGEISKNKNIMGQAIERMLIWQRAELKVRESYLRVFHDNVRAISLYERLGYKEILRLPLIKKPTADGHVWQEYSTDPYFKCDRYFVTMKQIHAPAGR